MWLQLPCDAEAITASLKRGLMRILTPRHAAPSGDTERWVSALATIAPPAAAIVAMMTLTLNLWLAGKITATSGRLHRPWPDLKSAELPPMTLRGRRTPIDIYCIPLANRVETGAHFDDLTATGSFRMP